MRFIQETNGREWVLVRMIHDDLSCNNSGDGEVNMIE